SDELAVRGALPNAHDLCPIVCDKTHAVDYRVDHPPRAVRPRHAIVDPQLAVTPRCERGVDDGHIPSHGFVDERDVHAARDPGLRTDEPQITTLQDIAEEPDKFLLLRWCACRPFLAEHVSGSTAHIEHLMRHAVDEG